MAASFHGVPWELTGSVGFENNTWELYNVDEDFSQAVDLAAKNPQKLEELKKVFAVEAEKFGVYPLDDRFVERGINPERPSVVKGRTKFSYAAGTTRIPEGSAPPIYQRSHKVIANVTVPKDGCEGVITATGGTTGGYTLFVEDGKVHYHYNFFGKKVTKVTADDTLPTGDVEIVLEYEQKPFRPFKETTGGTAKLSVNGKVVGTGRDSQRGHRPLLGDRDAGYWHGSRGGRLPRLPRPGAICIHWENQRSRYRDIAHTTADSVINRPPSRKVDPP